MECNQILMVSVKLEVPRCQHIAANIVSVQHYQHRMRSIIILGYLNQEEVMSYLMRILTHHRPRIGIGDRIGHAGGFQLPK